jgi:hypothetical protein
LPVLGMQPLRSLAESSPRSLTPGLLEAHGVHRMLTARIDVTVDAGLLSTTHPAALFIAEGLGRINVSRAARWRQAGNTCHGNEQYSGGPENRGVGWFDTVEEGC